MILYVLVQGILCEKNFSYRTYKAKYSIHGNGWHVFLIKRLSCSCDRAAWFVVPIPMIFPIFWWWYLSNTVCLWMPGNISPPITLEILKRECNFLLFFLIYCCIIIIIFFFAFLWNAKIGSQEIPGVTGKFGLRIQNEAGQRLNRVLPREHTGHSKQPLPTTLETMLYMDITRWSILKSDWLYSLQPKMEKLYTVSKNKTRSWLWFRSWTPCCKIQT